MDNWVNWFKAAVAAVGGVVGWFFGSADGFLYALIAFVVMDYITGVMCAVVDKELSSQVGFKGIFRKIDLIRTDDLVCAVFLRECQFGFVIGTVSGVDAARAAPLRHLQRHESNGA